MTKKPQKNGGRSWMVPESNLGRVRMLQIRIEHIEQVADFDWRVVAC